MPTDDEQLAEVTDIIERMIAAGELELATRRDTPQLARALFDALESDPALDLENYLLGQTSVVELFLDGDDLAARFAPLRARAGRADPEASWNDELAARIAEDPEDVEARLVFADWLEQRGDPRGELIQIQARPRDAELDRREQMFLDRWRQYLLGSLADEPRAKATFRWGFVDRLETPVAAFAAARAHPSLRFVRELRLVGAPESLLPLPPTLETLAVETRIGAPVVVSALVAGLARLKQLELRCNEAVLDVDTTPLPGLRGLALEVGSVEIPRGWARGTPALERLAVTVAEARQVDVLFGSPPPALTTLRLTSRAALARLLRTPLLRQLTVLDMSGVRNLVGVAALVREQAQQLEHLTLLDLRGSTPLDELQPLRDLGPHVKGPRQRR